VFTKITQIFFCSTATPLPKLRIPGVLQRFAGTYLVVATIHMFFAKTVDVSMVKKVADNSFN
jgi:hypothetical protein